MTSRGNRTAAIFAMALGFVLGPRVALEAGPTRYDPETRSFRFAYTYAALNPGVFGPSGIGASQDSLVGIDEDANVRALLEAINQALNRATGGRAQIAQLDRVATIKEADVVISMTGNPNRAGWATMGTIEGKPGQIGLFYPYLQQQFKQDVVLSAVHEFCHYIFGLVDEYDTTKFPSGCPRMPGGSGPPGCIMDNYLINGPRKGWYGRFCQDDHDARPAQQRSCQAIVDKFFADRGVGPEQADPALVNQNQRENLLASVRGFAIDRARSGREAEAEGGGVRRAAAVSSRVLEVLARRFLNTQLTREGVAASDPEIAQIITSALNFARPSDARTPPRDLPQTRVDQLLRFGRDLVLRQAREASGVRRRLDIRRELTAFARDIPEIGASPSAEAQRFLDQLARDLAARSVEEERFQRLVDAARLHIKFDQEIAVNTVEIATVLGIPGSGIRRENLRQLQEEAMRTLALPGRTTPRFGLRRTLIVAPDPIQPVEDAILTQSGIFLYPEVRNRYIRQFAKLVDRAKLLTPLVRGDEQGDRPLAIDDFRIQDAIAESQKNRADTPQNRLNRIQTILTRVVSLIADDQLENIILLVPPGGLGENLGLKLEILRDQLVGKTDLRLDIVLVGAERISPELRDLSVRSGGSILTITDVDEVGMIAQRLKNDQGSGAWVTVPLQGTLGAPEVPERGDEAAPRGDPREQGLTSANALLARLGAAPATVAGQAPAQIPAAPLQPPMPEALLEDSRPGATPYRVPTSDEEARMFLHRLFRPRPVGANGQPTQFLGINALQTLDGQRTALVQALLSVRYLEALELMPRGPLPDALRRRIEAAMQGPPAGLAPAEPTTVDEHYARFLVALDALHRLAHDPKFNANEELLPKDVPTMEAFRAVGDLRRAFRDFDGLYAEHLKQTVAEQPNPVAQQRKQEQMARVVRVLAGVVRDVEASLIPFTDEPPLFTRIDRAAVGRMISGLEYDQQGLPARVRQAGRVHYRLSRFYAEVDAEYELILGLSRPLPALAEGASIEDPRVQALLPRIALFSEPSLTVEAATHLMVLDSAASSETMLVYRLRQARGLSDTWINAALVVDDELDRRFEADRVNFTFTVGSARENVQLTPAMALRRFDPKTDRLDDLPPPNLLGAVNRSDGPIFLEVQVLGGTSVLGANLQGYLQRISRGSGPIELTSLTFSDAGNDVQGDRHADDGIYTATIPLMRLPSPAEYRVIVLGLSTDESRNIPAEDPMRFATEEQRRIAEEVRREILRITDTRAASDPGSEEPEPALRFQRATSFHFHVNPQ